MESVLTLDPNSLTNLARRLGLADLRLVEGRLMASVPGKDVDVELTRLDLAGRLRVGAVRLAVAGVRVEGESLVATFSVEP